MTNCVLRASLPGYVSNAIDLADPRIRETPNLPPFVLRPKEAVDDLDPEFNVSLPKAGQKAWKSALKAVESNDWLGAERFGRIAVQSQPRFAQGWRLVGAACMNQNKTADAREALQQSIDLDPKLLSSHLMLAQVNSNARDWSGVAKASRQLIALDKRRRYPEARFLLAAALYNLKQLDEAEQNLRDLIPSAQKMPRVEYILGLVLAARNDHAGAAEHLKRYLELEPKAAEADLVKAWLAQPDKTGASLPQPEGESVDLRLPAPGAIWIPGGMKALALAARIDKPFTAQDFVEVYSEALVRRGEPNSTQSISGFQGTLADYFAAVSALVQAGERKDDKSVFSLSLATPEKRLQAEKFLPLLGWKLSQEGGAARVELGSHVEEGTRQVVPALLGIRELEMQDALEAGRDFRIELVSESVHLIGGDAWAGMLPANMALPGGLAEAFARDSRLPKTYAALSAMGNDTASVLVEAVGLRTLTTQHANLLWNNPEVFRLINNSAHVPGGSNAVAVWTRLVGPSPREAKAFFRALFERDRGRLAGFFATVAKADAAHQAFLTRTVEDAERYYELFRDPYIVIRAGDTPRGIWPPRYFHDLPLDSTGSLRFPGLRQSWTNAADPDSKLLAKFGSPEALIAGARLEATRKTPLDATSARLFAKHFADWRNLIPYFERLPGLGAAEFTAMEGFEAGIRKMEPERRNFVMGEWHSLVELLALGAQSGALDAASGAGLFRRICTELQDRDSRTRAMAILREMAGGTADLQEAIPAKLLKLNAEKRVAYDRIMNMQKVPRLDARDDEAFIDALSGIVYAARLNPQFIVLREDSNFSRRHRFVDSSPDSPVFLPSMLRLTSIAPGSYFVGGFAGFTESAKKLAISPAQPYIGPGQWDEAESTPTSSFTSGTIREGAALFSTDARLVEVYTTVTDGRGRYVDNLRPDSFEILDEGNPQSIKAFESNAAGLSCALLLDTTGSMQAALPALKNAALRLIGELREEDIVAVYSFSDVTLERQAFTKNKRAAKRAVLPAYPHGRTALYDAVAEVAYSITGRSGKKVIVVFTDGDDNQSSVTADHGIRRAKLAGVPVYTIAQGAALNHAALLRQLEGISSTTGGLAFSIKEPKQIEAVFARVAADLKHGYLLAYQPPEGKAGQWRKIQVRLKGKKENNVRARDGYFQ